MSALSTPGGGGTTAQSKPTSGKHKYQKLDINSLYCANRGENSEPSLVKSQLCRKHGMQSLGKVPSARRPPANLPSLKTETGQDANANSIPTTTTTATTTPVTCTPQTTVTASVGVVSTPSSGGGGGGGGAAAGGGAAGGGGWSALPPPSSSHFRNEFPSLEAAAQPSHRDHVPTQPQHPQLRPHTEGSWTSGGSVRAAEGAGGAPSQPSQQLQQTPAFRAILPPFLMKGSIGGGGGLGGLAATRETRSPPQRGPAGGGARAPPPPRTADVLATRPILREEQISSLDEISHDAGWAMQDDIDYDQKLDFSDGESSTPSGNRANKSRITGEHERSDKPEAGDEEQLWAERRQKQNSEVAAAVARARQRKEEEQRRQRESMQSAAHHKDSRDDRDHRSDRERSDRDRADNRDRQDIRDRQDVRDRQDGRDRPENRDRPADRPETRERLDNRERPENRERSDNRDRLDNRDRDRPDVRENRDQTRDRDRPDNRERTENRERTDARDKERIDNRERERDRTDNRDRDRNDNRDKTAERDRDRNDRMERMDRSERDFRDYNRGTQNNNEGPFSKNFQSNIPPRFLKQQQNRQLEDQNKGWAFSSGKPGASSGRRQEPPAFNAPRHAPHNARRSYSRDYSDREDEFRREKDNAGPQWRSEMQDYERPGRDFERQNSKESHKDYSDRRSDSDRKSVESNQEHRTSAADKLSEVFDRKSAGAVVDSAPEPPVSGPTVTEPNQSSASTPPIKRESTEKEFIGSWADTTYEAEEQSFPVKLPEKIQASSKQDEHVFKMKENKESEESKHPSFPQPAASTRQSSPPVQAYNMVPHFAQTQQPKTQNYAQQLHQQTQAHHNHINIQQQGSSNQPQVHSPTSQPSQVLSQPPSQTPPALIAQFHQPNQNQQEFLQEQRQSPPSQLNLNRSAFGNQKSDKLIETEMPAKTPPELVVSMSQVIHESRQVSEQTCVADSQKKTGNAQADDKGERFTDQLKLAEPKESIERKNSGSGSEKKGRGYGGGFGVYGGRVWGSRESRRRPHRNSRSDNRASESDGSPDGGPHADRKERRRGPRSPRAPKKNEGENVPRTAPNPVLPQPQPLMENMENREAFAPRGQPSRRGRGGFQGATRPPAPAKRVAGYGPPNTKSPFSQATQVRTNEEGKERVATEDKPKGKPRMGSSAGRQENRGRDRRNRGPGHVSGEDENWETTSEHSDGGNAGRGRAGQRSQHKGQGGERKGPQQGSGGRSGNNSGRSSGNQRNSQVPKKESSTVEITEAVADLKISALKKDGVDEPVDDGFQEVRNKKNSKEARAPSKEDQKQQPKPQANQSTGRNGSSTRNSSEKSSSLTRGTVQPPAGKPAQSYDRNRHPRDNLAPRFMKQRQKQQLGLNSAFGPDTGAAPPPPAINAWDKPIAQSLRGNVEEPVEIVDKSAQSSQRSTPCTAPAETKATAVCALDKTGMLDGATPPVETLIFENTNYKSTPPSESALKQKFAPAAVTVKPEEMSQEVDARTLTFNGDVRLPPRSIQELIAENGRPATAEPPLGLPMSFEVPPKAEDSSDMKLDFAFDSDLGQLTEEKTSKALGLQRTHMGVSTISPSAADLNLKIASVKKVWEMPAVAEGAAEELVQFAGGVGFEEASGEGSAPPNVCKVKPTQQLQSPPPQHYNHVGYAGGYGGLSVPSPPAVLFNSSQQLLGSSQQLPQQGGLYGAFLDQSRGQFGGFPGAPYGAGSGPYNYQPPPDMFQNLPNQYRMAPGAGAAFGQSGQLANSPSTVLISSSSNSLMSTSVKPSGQQIGAIGSKGGGVGGVSSAYQAAAAQQYLGYSGPVGEVAGQYTLPGLMQRPAPPASSYYSPYQPPPQAPAPPTYPLQFTQPAQSAGYSSQYLSSQLQVAAAAAVQQMQQQYRAPLQQQYGAPTPRPGPPPQHHQPSIKSPLHEHANGFVASMAPGGSSPTPKQSVKPPSHSPPHHKYHQPPPSHVHSQHAQHAQHSQHTQHTQHHQNGMFQMAQQVQNSGRCGGGAGAGGLARVPPPQAAPRYPAPIQRPHAPAYRPAPPPAPQHRYYAPPNQHHHQPPRSGGAGAAAGERAVETAEVTGTVGAAEEAAEMSATAAAGAAADAPPTDGKAD